MSEWGSQTSGPGSSDLAGQSSREDGKGGGSTELTVLSPIVPPIPTSSPFGSPRALPRSISPPSPPSQAHLPPSCPSPTHSRHGTPSVHTTRSDRSSGMGKSSQTESRPLFSSHIHSQHGRPKSSGQRTVGSRSHHGTHSGSGGSQVRSNNSTDHYSHPSHGARRSRENMMMMVCSAGPILLFPLGCLIILIALIILAIISPASLSPAGGGFGVASILPIPAAILLVISLFITSRVIRKRREAMRIQREQERERERSMREREKQKQSVDRERRRRKKRMEEEGLDEEDEEGGEEKRREGGMTPTSPRHHHDRQNHRGSARSDAYGRAPGTRARSGSQGSVLAYPQTPPPVPKRLPPVASTTSDYAYREVEEGDYHQPYSSPSAPSHSPRHPDKSTSHPFV
ncbi:MAG: hypothetical protein DHS80DRAFT_30626 [Piptocephalis tieghemiana]|nr:MAG: hypothetical protein DHS80DRAFT_30626 [Piptocephalis tieghemiana]